MANIDQRKPGSFCWLELGTTDQNAAKTFYGSLFGWTAKDEPMGPESFYTMFQLGGKAVGAAYTLRPDQLALDIPPHWMLYVAVDNADASAERASQSGGTVLMPPFDVMDEGRMSLIRDPTGAHFCVWQAKKTAGFQIAGEPGSLCWADLNTHDPARARQFYGELFGWQFTEDSQSDPVPGYLHIHSNGEQIGGVFNLEPKSAETPAHWMPYILVSNCDSAAAKALQLGGCYCIEPMTLKGIGKMAIMVDPQSAAFAIFQPIPKSA